MIASSHFSLRFGGGLPDSYRQARREASQRRELLAESSEQLALPTKRLLHDLIASIAYQAQVRTPEHQAMARRDVQRIETVLAHKIQQMGRDPRATASTRQAQVAMLQAVEESLDAMDGYGYEVSPILTSALLLALERLGA